MERKNKKRTCGRYIPKVVVNARAGNVRAAVLRTRGKCRGFGGMNVKKSLLEAWENHGFRANDVHTDLGFAGFTNVLEGRHEASL